MGDGLWAIGKTVDAGKWVTESGQCERGQNDGGRREVGDANMDNRTLATDYGRWEMGSGLWAMNRGSRKWAM